MKTLPFSVYSSYADLCVFMTTDQSNPALSPLLVEEGNIAAVSDLAVFNHGGT